MGVKKVFSTRLDEGLLKQLKHLAIDADLSLGDLLEQAISDLLRRYQTSSRSETENKGEKANEE